MSLSRRLHWHTRRLTARARGLPDFIIIGAPRSGTTTLYQALASHEKVVPASSQEVHFFNRTSTYERGIDYYRAFFPLQSTLRSRAAITGEGTSVYMYRPNTAERIASDLDDTRLIAILRDPVERAIASWSAFNARGEDLRPLEEAIDAELDSLGPGEETPPPPKEVGEGQHDPAHVQKGRYADQLTRWMDLFGPTRMMTILSEDLFGSPEETLSDVQGFLGLPPATLGLEVRPQEPFSVSDRIKERLVAYYAAPNAELARLLRRTLPWA